jgi:hypothetical protein
MYAAIPTLPIAAALAAAGSETAELNGGSCGLLDRPDKKQVHSIVLIVYIVLREMTFIASCISRDELRCFDGKDRVCRSFKPLREWEYWNWSQVCLFYCSETEDLARRIAAETDSIELKSIRWGTFADGFPNLFVPNAHGIRSQHVAFLASFSSPGVIFEQLSIIYALPRMFVSSFTLVLPFFPTGTLERMEDEGDVATAFTLARILSNIPISRGGPTSLVIFDIHALQVCLSANMSQLLSTYNFFFWHHFHDGTFQLFTGFVPLSPGEMSQADELNGLRKGSILVTMCCHALKVASPCWNIVCISCQMPTI